MDTAPAGGRGSTYVLRWPRTMTRDEQRRLDYQLHRIRRPKSVQCRWCGDRIRAGGSRIFVVSRTGNSRTSGGNGSDHTTLLPWQTTSTGRKCVACSTRKS